MVSLVGGGAGTATAAGIPALLEAIPDSWGFPGAIAVITLTLAGNYGAALMEEVRGMRGQITRLTSQASSTAATVSEHGRWIRDLTERLGRHSATIHGVGWPNGAGPDLPPGEHSDP